MLGRKRRETACLVLMLALPLSPRLFIRGRYPCVKNGIILATGGWAILCLAAEIPLLGARHKRKPAGFRPDVLGHWVTAFMAAEVVLAPGSSAELQEQDLGHALPGGGGVKT